ncbi:MAG TPA: hypothetical protein VKH81_04470 [Candidatus Angelobacter sp.]|nr:hypothetical protein [Candidatus Angelobacter sp.]
MHRISFKLLVFFALATTMLSAQATRTWVSGVGDDANPCSRTAPCKTWAGAISKTAVGGEIDALDPGGFGAVTITKAITLDGGGGQVGSVLVAGTNGIVVQANAATDVVILRNLRINGIGSGLNGIRFLAGKDLNVENCFIFGFTQNGIDIALNQANQATVHVLNTVLKNNSGVGIRATNAIAPPVQVVVDNSAAILDTTGMEAASHSRITLSRSVVENASADGVKADDAASDAQITIDHSDISFNVNGITASTGGSIAVADSKIAFNSGTAMNQAGGGISSYQTNRLHSNGALGTFTPIPQL